MCSALRSGGHDYDHRPVTIVAARTIRVLPKHVLVAQLAVISAMAAAYVVTKAMHVLGGHDQLLGLGPLFDLEGEFNVPAIYSAIAIVLTSLLLLRTALLCQRLGRRDVMHWYFLAAIFLLLAYDEAFSLHEQIAPFVSEALHNQRPVHLNWMIGGIVFLAFVSLISLRFVLRLDRRSRILMLASGVVFISGAIGFEVLGGLRLQSTPSNIASPDVVYFGLALAEESFEMLGIALFNYALLDHMRRQFGEAALRLHPRRTTPGS